MTHPMRPIHSHLWWLLGAAALFAFALVVTVL